MTAVRTGCGKSQVSFYAASVLKQHGIKVVVLRHPMPYGAPCAAVLATLQQLISACQPAQASTATHRMACMPLDPSILKACYWLLVYEMYSVMLVPAVQHQASLPSQRNMACAGNFPSVSVQRLLPACAA